MWETIYHTAPAWIANTLTAVFYHFFIVRTKIIPAWPIDLGLQIKKKRIFGDNKPFFASMFVIVSGTCIGVLQEDWFVGFLMGTVVLVGSLLNSFIKRQLCIPPGGNFFPWDQLDYALAVSIFSLVFPNVFPMFSIPVFLLFAFCYQFGVNFLAYKLGFIKKFLWWERKNLTDIA